MRRMLLTAALLSLPVAAMASEPIQGLYIGAAAGANFMQSFRTHVYTPPGLGGGASGNIVGNTGFAGVGSVGWGFGNGLRAEIEGDFRSNGIRHFQSPGLPTAASGSVRNYGVMANVLYDVNLPYFSSIPFMSGFQPYIGAGAGYMWTHLNDVSFSNPAHSFAVDGSSGKFAWQAIAGLGYQIPSMPNLTLTLEYRYLDITGGGHIAGATRVGGAIIPATYDVGAQHDHSIMVGLRWAFNTAAPPPPAPAPTPAAAPAPAVQPSRSYLVFFDWDKANLTPRARQIIHEAADNSTHVQYTQIQVNGYTDTSGSAQYNQRLSVRRADAVASELVRDGVPRNAISIQGFGETHLLVPTGEGVREPQNRRVEIIIH
ncbi:MAG TPA: OmpA family protein [Acetobacteraceae bacterium]|nr:OmpA family protein [Acetobacteraceae bacterium]